MVRVFVMQDVVWAGQSVGALQPTQWPLPSHTLPLLSLHIVPAAAFMTEHAPLVHSGTAQTVPLAGQSDAIMQLPPVPEVVVEPPVPAAPPVLGILLRSTVAMSSQPVRLAPSMPAATARAAKKLIL
jgi:hypothetical protein